MKQPRLPGAEKFKFASMEKTAPSVHPMIPKQRQSLLSQSSEQSLSPHYTYNSRVSPNSSQGELSILTSTLSVPVLNRSDSRRRAVLPITCKKTSRMLNNTNLELNVNHADLISEDTVKPRLDSNRVPSCPNLESSRSLNSSKTSLDTYFRKMSLQNPTIREMPSNFDWKNIRASPSRLSASCSSSCSSEENVWVLRGDL